ncbi:MAG: glycosyltransferase family 4 protein [Bdellovibrionales bacterium]
MTRSKIKVLHVNDIASVGSTIVKALRRQGIEADLQDLPKPLGKFSLGVKWVGALARYRAAAGIIRHARENGFNILHIHYLSSIAWFIFSDIPIVAHAHGSDVRVSVWNVFRHVINWMACRKARVIYYSTPDMECLLKRYTQHACFLPNPVDSEDFRPYEGPRENYILLFSALNHIKGADLALAAIEKIRRKRPDIEFRVFGGGEYEDEARRLGLTILPKIPRSEIPELVGKASLVLGQFRVGAIGMSELEVLALGRTVACHFAYPKIYHAPPPFISANTPDEIVDVIETFLANPSAYEYLDRKARSWFVSNHSSDRLIQPLLKEYESLITNSKPRVIIFSPGRSSWIESDIRIMKEFGSVISVDILEKKKHRFWEILRFIWKADILFFWFGSFHYLPYLIVGRLLGKRISMVAGGYDVDAVPEIGYGAFSAGWLRRLIRRLVFLFPRRVLAVSKYSQDQARKHLWSVKKIECVPLSTGNMASDHVRPWNQRKRQVAILLSARDDDYLVKGVDRIPDLCRLLPDISFKLAGSLSASVRKRLEMEQLSNLVLTGFLEFGGPEFRDLLEESRVVLLSSRCESFGVALIDGALMGCVPVSFAVGALPEVIEGIGRLVPPGNVHLLAQAVRDVMDLKNFDNSKIQAAVQERFSYARRRDALRRLCF